MANRNELPRPIENSGQQHLPCVVLMDTSGSMSGYEPQLRDGLQALIDGINDDDTARQRVELCVATFDDTVTVLENFGSMASFEMPRISKCAGMTHMHEAIRKALDLVEERKAMYRTSNTTWNRPWIFLLTDGGANDPDNGAEAALLDSQAGSHCIFYGVGLGNEADTGLLRRLNINNMCFGASKEDFKGAFQFLSHSISKTSKTTPGQNVTLPNPSNYQLTVQA